MIKPPFNKRRLSLMCSLAAAGVLSATAVYGWQSPTEHRYLTKPLQICDQGIFYVGGAPKVTPFHSNPTPEEPRQIIIGSMYVEFQVPMVSKAWPLIMVHGSGYTGTAVRGTAGGNEGWSDYTVRNGIPTYVIDQAGRARSSFDKSVINEAEYLIDVDPAAAMDLLPNFGGSTSSAWTSWFGHIVPDDTDISTGQMVRHGAPAIQSDGTPAPGQDPECADEPAHCEQLGRIPMEPEAPWAVDQAIASRTGNGAPAGLGTVVPDVGGHVNPDFPLNDRYLALDAYKFNVPNTEETLPTGECPTCDPTTIQPDDWWTPKALAELIEGLGGAVVATHSQSGIQGHHLARVLKEQGTLDLLKGLITIEGNCSFTVSGLNAADFADNNIPYMALFSDIYSSGIGNLIPVCQASVDAINAAGGNAALIDLTQPGSWQGSYAGPFGPDYVGPFAGVSHMMMIEDNPAPDGRATNLQVMDVILEWADENISKPRPQACGDFGKHHDKGHGKGHGKHHGKPHGKDLGQFLKKYLGFLKSKLHQ